MIYDLKRRILPFDSGIYLLEIQLVKSKKITIGKAGIYAFPAGYYYYIGTAQRNLKARLDRHLRKDKKKHWHIDYLLSQSAISQINAWPAGAQWECKLAGILAEEGGQVIVPGFGSSDCSCNTHLYYFLRSISRDVDKIIVTTQESEIRMRKLGKI